ncbi:MAG TPA: response regulator [Salinisphaeraceae bacterium]|nr:response regulator [Salinisphaeraceae bacterium]
MKPLIHVIDDDTAHRDSMRVLLCSMGMEVDCYATAQEFLETFSTVRPGCILLDLRMPGMSGLELQRLFREWQKPVPIIFLSGHADVETTVRAMHQGAAEFLTKPVNEEVLLQKIHTAIEQSRQLRQEYNRRSALQARLDLLSPRERQVLDGVYEGLSNKEIARRLCISHKTVELHRSNLMTKMRANSLAQLVRMRMEAGQQES